MHAEDQHEYCHEHQHSCFLSLKQSARIGCKLFAQGAAPFPFAKLFFFSAFFLKAFPQPILVKNVESSTRQSKVQSSGGEGLGGALSVQGPTHPNPSKLPRPRNLYGFMPRPGAITHQPQLQHFPEP